MSDGPGNKNGASQQRIGRGLRSRVVLDADPGPDLDFVDMGPVAISAKVRSEDRERFYAAIRSQGPEQVDHAEAEGGSLKVRRRAIDMAKERARMDPRLSDAAFRFFEAAASRCKWRHRYYHQSMDMLSFIASKKPGHGNAARYVDGPVQLGYLVDIHVPSETGGRHKRYLTVACTAADRTGQTLADIEAAAKGQEVRGESESEEEIVTNHHTQTLPQTSGLPNRAIRSSDALSYNSGKAIRNPDVSTRSPDVSTRSPDVSMRSPDALTLDKHLTNAKGGEGGARPTFANGVHRCRASEQEVTPHSPPPAECELQHKSDEVCAEFEGASDATYVIHRSWWPGLTDAEADRILDGHLKPLTGSNPARRLEQIILSLRDEHALGRVRQPGKLVERRIEQANSQARAGKAAARSDATAEPVPFKPWEILGQVGFGGKVTGADANDILAAVPGSDKETVRRLIREVCGNWAGPNGNAKSTQHVVDEVIRRLRAPDATSRAEQPAEPVRVGKPTKEDAAKLAALAKQMASARSPTGT
jgi:hypothetical protein